VITDEADKRMSNRSVMFGSSVSKFTASQAFSKFKFVEGRAMMTVIVWIAEFIGEVVVATIAQFIQDVFIGWVVEMVQSTVAEWVSTLVSEAVSLFVEWVARTRR
jgi:hypothetical protein